MMSYEELETLVNSIKDRLDETTGALVSEDLLSLVANYKIGIDEIKNAKEEIAKLKSDKDELLKVNGRLFQKVGFDKEEEKMEEKEDLIDEIKIEDIIDERGEMI